MVYLNKSFELPNTAGPQAISRHPVMRRASVNEENIATQTAAAMHR